MTTSESLSPGGGAPNAPSGKGRRFAKERLGAWVFAASFSIGVWGLALKVMSPSHVEPVATTVPRRAMLTPSNASDGRAAIVWENEVDSPVAYPVTGAVPIMPLGATDATDQDHG
jgi:hypothetical protein